MMNKTQSMVCVLLELLSHSRGSRRSLCNPPDKWDVTSAMRAVHERLGEG